ncbi:RNA-binding S4 domain-containing protein [Agarivorans sp.]|uniref:RNA-binding S4 domain-containing protein n=1 Tax=Agarivorans sp. TaxID=1872412 RepID=UPI003CFE244C
MKQQQDPSQEIEVEALDVIVQQQPIELYKVLKIGNLVNGGGEAKLAIAEGYVGLNGEVEQRKRKKVYAGDIIEFNGQFLYVVCDEAPSEVSPKQSKPKQAQSKSKQTEKAVPSPNSKTGRRSIKF